MQKAAFEKMVDLDIEKMVFIVIIIDLDAKILAEKAMMTLFFEINGSSIYIVMVLIN